MLPVLFKNGKRGLEQWKVWVEDHGDSAEIVVEWGLSDGAKQTKSTFIIEGKNIGKSNETNYLEQAESEAESKWNKQKDKNYSEDGLEVKILPMLAHKYRDHSHKIKYPAYVSAKLDGLRMMASNKFGISRKGKQFKSIPHILSSCQTLPDNLVLDGELFSQQITFQEIQSITRKDKPSEKSPLISYNVFDLIILDNLKASFTERYKVLQELDLEHISILPQYLVNSESEVFQKHELFLYSKHEGTMIRNDAPYEMDHRSHNLLKIKDFDDAEFEIVGGKEDKNGHCVFTCKIGNETFDCKPKGDDELRRSYLKNLKSLTGKMLTVEYFGLTNDGKPRFPIGKAIRD